VRHIYESDTVRRIADVAKKLRRKDLKRPDEFVSRTMRLGEWVRGHQRLATIAGLGLVAAVVAVALTIHLMARSRVGSSEGLWTAMDVLVSPLAPSKNDDEQEDREPPRGYETFDTTEARAKAASKAFRAVHDEHRGRAAGQVAALGLAGTEFSLGEYAKARRLYEEFLSDTGGLDQLKVIAVEGIGYCLEADERYDKALEKFRELEKLDGGRYRDLAQYHQARMLEKLNKSDDAAELYRAVVRRAEQAGEETEVDLFVQDRAESRLAVIDPGADVLKARSKNRGADLLRQLMSGEGGGPGGAPPGLPPGFPGAPADGPASGPR
jgi:tetratricopeptide (TPR) repeat protein